MDSVLQPEGEKISAPKVKRLRSVTPHKKTFSQEQHNKRICKPICNMVYSSMKIRRCYDILLEDCATFLETYSKNSWAEEGDIKHKANLLLSVLLFTCWHFLCGEHLQCSWACVIHREHVTFGWHWVTRHWMQWNKVTKSLWCAALILCSSLFTPSVLKIGWQKLSDCIPAKHNTILGPRQFWSTIHKVKWS